MQNSMSTDNASRHPCEALFDAVVQDPALTSIERMVAYYETQAKDYLGNGIYEMCLGMLWLQGKRYEKARTALRAGLATQNVYHQKLHYALVSIDIEQGHFAKAKEAARELTQTFPDWAGGHRLLMMAAMGEQAWAEATVHGEAAIERARDPAVFLGLTMAHHRLGQHREAVAALREALLIDSRLVAQPTGINQGSHSFLHLGQYADARHLIEARMRLDPRAATDQTLKQAIDILNGTENPNGGGQ